MLQSFCVNTVSDKAVRYSLAYLCVLLRESLAETEPLIQKRQFLINLLVAPQP